MPEFNKVHFMSEKEDWTTPKDLFDGLNEEFNFTVDLCASDENHLLNKYYTIQSDGLKADLSGEIVYCNPPYGKKTEAFVKKCALSDCVAVMLLPARTDTKWFHEYIYRKAEIRFIKGRLKFGNSKNNAPFPSMIAIFRGEKHGKE